MSARAQIAKARAAVTPEVPGALSTFTLLTRVARGGMADVILAERTDDEDKGDYLAIKLLLPRLAQRRKFVDMFRSEGKLGVMLNHRNIVRTLEVGTSGPIHFIVMEFIDGQDLGRVLRYFRNVEAPVPIATTLWVIREVLNGLEYAHNLADENGMPLHLVNRDVSPANVMLGYDGGVRIIDFGIAQALIDYRSQIGSIKGKVTYMSPEQVRGLALDARSDLFSVGTVLYQLLTMREPFHAPSEFEQMERVREANPAPAHTVSKRVNKALSDVVACAMSKDPSVRYQTAAEMVAAIEGYARSANIELNGSALSEFMKTEFGDARAKFIGAIEEARGILESSDEILEEIPEDATEPDLDAKVDEVQKVISKDTSPKKMVVPSTSQANPKWLLPAFLCLVVVAICLALLAILR